MIGGGTGIAPIQAILHGMETAGRRRARDRLLRRPDWESLHALDNLRSMSYRNRWLDVVPVVNRRRRPPGPRSAGSPRP